MPRLLTADGYRVVSAFTGKAIPRALWADPDTGEYGVERDMTIEEVASLAVAAVLAVMFGMPKPPATKLIETKRGAIRVVRAHPAPASDPRVRR